MANNTATARKPATKTAAAKGAKVETVPPMAGAAPDTAPATGWPAADNGAAWQALLIASVPEMGAARGHKYGDGKGMFPVAAVLYGLTAFGQTAAANGGKGKSGKHTVQALLCVAHKLAQAACGTEKVCGAAVGYFAYTAPVLALLQPPVTKTALYIGKPKPGAYNVPCPRWVSDYVRGNARNPAMLFA